VSGHRRLSWWLGSSLLLAAAAGLAATAPASQASGGAVHSAAAVVGSPQTPIKHIVFIQKENRSFDEYFGALSAVNQGGDAQINGATSAKKHDGTVVSPLPQTPDPLPNDVDHSAWSFGKAYDNGAMDGFDTEKGAYSSTGKPLALSQMQPGTIPDYTAYATTYGLGDNTFASWRGASFGNNIYEVAGQAGRYDTATGCVPNLAVSGTQACHTGGLSVAGIPVKPKGTTGTLGFWGCDDPIGTTSQMIDNSTGKTSLRYPCFLFKSLPDELTADGVSWKYYANAQTQHHDALDSIDSIRNSPSQWSNVQPESHLTTDIAAGKLPDVSWVVPRWTDHPPQTACNGENETVQLVNAIMNSPYWSSTAIVMSWDEWGGFYDHVKPPLWHGNASEHISYGFRVPLVVISPYVKSGNLAWNGNSGGYVDHTFYSHASLLKFIETAFAVAPLGTDDADPTTGGNLMNFFDFTQTPKPALLLKTRTCAKITAAQMRMIASEGSD
jgi:phospholipase C